MIKRPLTIFDVAQHYSDCLWSELKPDEIELVKDLEDKGYTSLWYHRVYVGHVSGKTAVNLHKLSKNNKER